jgi:hypothetical protein
VARAANGHAGLGCIVPFVRHPHPARLARTRAQRWGLWILLALLVLTPVVVCRGASSPAPAESSLAVSASCDGELGHDVMCARGLTTAAAPGTRGGRDDAAHDVLGLITVVVMGVAVAGAGIGLAARYRTTAGPPPWASQRLVPGRHQLVAVGIARV